MKMSIGEKKILFVFGCPNHEATVDRLYQVADLIPDPAGRKAVEVLAEKLDSEGVEKWYRCFFYNMIINFKEDYFMKMSIGEKKILFVFGCPNHEATVDRLYQVADLIPDPAGRKAVEVLAEKLDSEGVEKWYRCFFYNMKLEMEAYYRHKAILNRIVGGSMEVDNDEIDED